MELCLPVPECLHSGFYWVVEVASGDNWSYKPCKSPCQIVTTDKPTPNILQAGCPCVAQRTVSSTEGTARRFLFAVIMQSNVAAVSNTTELRRCGILFTVARF